jgi:hypothetical protein
MFIPEGFLDTIKFTVRPEPFNCCNSSTVRLYCEEAARLHGCSIERNRAGSAKRGLATDMRAGESELVSQKVDEQEARLDFGRVAVSIHSEGNGALHSMPSLMLLIGLRYQIFGLLVNPSNWVI